MLGAQVIAMSDTSNKNLTGITNLLFGVQLLGQGSVNTRKFRQLTPSAIRKQIMRPMVNQNQNQALEQNQETQNTIANNDISPPIARPRGQPPPGQEPTGP
ncbi:MAG: hypothetical protein EZS28_045023, partial [Streblomastix strix]